MQVQTLAFGRNFVTVFIRIASDAKVEITVGHKQHVESYRYDSSLFHWIIPSDDVVTY